MSDHATRIAQQLREYSDGDPCPDCKTPLQCYNCPACPECGWSPCGGEPA